jgi:hypothetical protein
MVETATMRTTTPKTFIGFLVAQPGTIWLLSRLSGRQVDRLRRSGDLNLVDGRFLQNYLAATEFEAVFFLYDREAMEGGKAKVNLVMGAAFADRGLLDQHLDFTFPGLGDPHHKELTHPRYRAVSIIDVRFLRDEAERRLKDIGKRPSDLFSIKEASVIWSDLGLQMKKNIQLWMRKLERVGPIFHPVEWERSPGRRGSRLDFSDLVTIALIKWLLRHGLSFADFNTGAFASLESA